MSNDAPKSSDAHQRTTPGGTNAEANQPGEPTAFPDGMPPTQTAQRMPAPPHDAAPTSAQLKADINSGKTGDKIGVHDPGLSPLGTDDEAAGTPPTRAQISLARRLEGVTRWIHSTPRGTSHTEMGYAEYVYLGGIAAIGLILVVGVGWVR